MNMKIASGLKVKESMKMSTKKVVFLKTMN